jgi:DNA-binding NarL/FixJ family response regulator
MASQPITLLLVDDHKVVLLGLSTLFATTPNIKVVGEASTAADEVAQCRRLQPNVVLMDVRLPDASGAEACREIREVSPNTRVVMLTSYSDEDAIIASITAGASGYLVKRTDPERLIDAVEAVARGEPLLDPAATQVAMAWLRRLASAQSIQTAPLLATDDLLGSLSDQERKILDLIAAGKTNREIAPSLSLSESTVKTYVSNILQKLHLARRAQAAAYLARRQATLNDLRDLAT